MESQDVKKLVDIIKKPPNQWNNADFLIFLKETKQKSVKKKLQKLEEEENKNQGISKKILKTIEKFLKLKDKMTGKLFMTIKLADYFGNNLKKENLDCLQICTIFLIISLYKT